MNRRTRPAVLTCLTVAALLAGGAARAQDADRLAIFFGDPALEQNEGTATTFPAFDTAYLVLVNPSLPDVGGWECRITADGPGMFLAWEPVGQAVNFATPPEFIVGLGSPLPAAPQVVLASSQALITGPGPVTFSLRPVFTPSLPGQMAYIPFENKEPLTPLLPWGGTPDVAGYNRTVPFCQVSATNLDFGVQGLTTVTRRSLTVTNIGGGSLPVDAELGGAYPPYRLVAGGDPTVLGPGQSVVVTVEFQPQAVGEFPQVLDLGTGCGSVPLWGMGREPLVELSFNTGLVDFGQILLGTTRSRSFYATNTGEVSVVVTPALADSCGDFVLAPLAPMTLHPNASLRVDVVFAPVTAGTQECAVVFGEGLAAMPLRGVGVRPPNADIVVSPAAVDFGTVLVGTVQSRTVTVTNEGGESANLSITLLEACGGLSVWPNGTTATLNPGQSLALQVQYAPIVAGTCTTSITLGQDMPVIMIAATAITSADGLRAQPASLDFGGVALGSWTERTVTVINEMASAITIHPEVDPATGFSLTGSPVAITLPGGGRHTATLKFQPVELGPHAGELTLGPGLTTVPLAGVGAEELAGWTVWPTSVDYGVYYVDGIFTDRTVTLTNTGNASQLVHISLDTGGFSPFVLVNGGDVWVQPGGTYTVIVRFSTRTAGAYTANLVLGDIAVVPLTCTAVADAPACFVHATSIEFGTVLVGGTAVQSTYVTNTGNEALTLQPHSSCDDFVYVGGPVLLDVGASAAVQVAFNPTTTGEHVCVLDLGPAICAKVLLFGQGSDSLVPDHDLVGVWFDAGLTTGIRNDLQIGQAVPAWLAMINPSETAGVSGWELRLDLDDGLYLAGYALEGLAFNFEDAPSFFVGLGTPLPYGPQVLLATFEFLVTDLETHAVDLVPLWQPSIPGGLAWVYGENFDLKPMHPISGLPSVAWLTAAPSVPVTAPTPTALLSGGLVELRWTLADPTADGCHVYRSLGDQETRLTTEPLQPAGGRFLFSDDTAGLPAGATVAYSYAVLKDGQEVARSSAATVQLSGAVPAATRLLANRPNPFNPETVIPFELARGGAVRIEVFDVSGRRVAVLAEGHRDAGLHEVTWQGRDDAGRAVPSGAYYVRMQTVSGRDTRKVMLLK